jgi:hypothetical protein
MEFEDNETAEFNTGESGIVFGIVFMVLDQSELPRAFTARTTTLYVIPLVRPLTSYCKRDGNPIFTIAVGGAVIPYSEY